MNNQVTIEEKTRTYDIKMEYHSDLMCQNYDAEILASTGLDGRITITPPEQYAGFLGTATSFLFENSDPDRVIALAQMMMAAAQMVKNHNQKPIDTNNEV